MQNDPLLRGPYLYEEGGARYRLWAMGGLDYIRGNSAPYFSLTCSQDRLDEHGRWQDDTGGANHDLILRFWPELADLAALHLSDIDGVPMHAEGNAFYFAVGGQWCGDLWLADYGPKYGEPSTRDERRDMVRRYLRCDADMAEVITNLGDLQRERLAEVRRRTGEIRRYALEAPMGIGVEPSPITHTRDYEAEAYTIINAMRPRWKAEADACIAKHGLVVYGDAWSPK